VTTQTDVYLKIEEHNLKLLSKNMIKKLILITVISIISIHLSMSHQLMVLEYRCSSPYGLTQTKEVSELIEQEIQIYQYVESKH